MAAAEFLSSNLKPALQHIIFCVNLTSSFVYFQTFICHLPFISHLLLLCLHFINFGLSVFMKQIFFMLMFQHRLHTWACNWCSCV